MKLFVILFFAVFGVAWAQFDLNLQIPTNSGSSPEAQQNPSNSGAAPQAQQDPSNFALGLQIPNKDSSSNFGFNLQIPINPGQQQQGQSSSGPSSQPQQFASPQQQQGPSSSGSFPQWQQYPSNPQAPQPQPYPSYTPITCPPKNYYINRKDHMSWDEAKKRCQFNGMQLATIDTREKYNNLRMQLDALDTGDGFWAYGTSLGRGAFYWPATNQEFTFADWGPGQPDHYGGNENCLDFRKYNGQYRFNDLNCADRQGFICEYP